MVVRIRSIAVIQCAFVLAVFYALLGIVYGLIWWLAFIPFMNTFGGAKTAGASGFLVGAGALSVVIFFIGFAIIGFIAGLIYALLYNLAARWTGGIEWTQVPVETPTVTTTSLAT